VVIVLGEAVDTRGVRDAITSCERWSSCPIAVPATPIRPPPGLARKQAPRQAVPDVRLLRRHQRGARADCSINRRPSAHRGAMNAGVLVMITCAAGGKRKKWSTRRQRLDHLVRAATEVVVDGNADATSTSISERSAGTRKRRARTSASRETPCDTLA